MDNLHLKSYLTMAGPDLVTVGASPGARAARKVIQENAHFKYDFFEVPDETGANCVYLNKTLIHTSKSAFPESAAKIEEMKLDAKKIPISMTEMNKVDGCLTCCSVLIT